VLPFDDATAALNALEESGASILGWEGWLRYSDNRLGHSAKYQGTADLAQLPLADAYNFCRATIRDAYQAFLSSPEVEGGELLFCLTYDS
jgi:hypothetical protein